MFKYCSEKFIFVINVNNQKRYKNNEFDLTLINLGFPLTVFCLTVATMCDFKSMTLIRTITEYNNVFYDDV